MSAMEKSDLPKVARKRANKAVSTAAEPVERRGGTKENADLQSTVRTQSREAVSQAQARIREAVTRNRQGKLTALLHHINIDVLRASFFGLKKSAAPGVDEMTWTDYAETLEANLVDLHAQDGPRLRGLDRHRFARRFDRRQAAARTHLQARRPILAAHPDHRGVCRDQAGARPSREVFLADATIGAQAGKGCCGGIG
jgi:hypothetical protein